MFARALNGLMNGVALATAAVIMLAGGMACSKCVDSVALALPYFSAMGTGANVIPLPTAAADTLAKVMASLVTHDGDSTISYSYTVVTAPNGTIDSVAIYTVASGGPLPATASAILCATAAGCTGSGTSAKLGTGYPALPTAMRGYDAQLVVFTTTRQKADGGAIRGVIYPVGDDGGSCN